MARKKKEVEMDKVVEERMREDDQQAAEAEATKEAFDEISMKWRILNNKKKIHEGRKEAAKESKEAVERAEIALYETIDKYNKKLPLFDGSGPTPVVSRSPGAGLC